MKAKKPIDDNPKTAFGMRKPTAAFIPPVSFLHLGRAMEYGADKYGPFNWRDRAVSSTVYYGGMDRHQKSWFDGETIDPESGVHHLGMIMANCAILLDAEAQGNLIDDRPKPGTYAKLLRELTRHDD